MIRAILAVAVVMMAAATTAHAQSGVRIGTLTCRVDPGTGFIVGSRKNLSCRFNGNAMPNERYFGSITKIGIDIGRTGGGEIVWAVLAPSSDIGPGALEGRYFGASAEATAGVGMGANVLVGGFDRAINLQPLSVSGQIGVNIAAGISGMRLVQESTSEPVRKR